MVCYDMTIFGWDTTIWKSGNRECQKNLNIDKIAFKVVQINFLAMHITNKNIVLIYLLLEIYKISSWNICT